MTILEPSISWINTFDTSWQLGNIAISNFWNIWYSWDTWPSITVSSRSSRHNTPNFTVSWTMNNPTYNLGDFEIPQDRLDEMYNSYIRTWATNVNEFVRYITSHFYYDYWTNPWAETMGILWTLKRIQPKENNDNDFYLKLMEGDV